MKKKKRIKKSRKKRRPQNRHFNKKKKLKKIKKFTRKKTLKKTNKRKKVKSKIKAIKKNKFIFPKFTIKIKPPNFRNFFSLISRPVFEAYYNFQRDRQRKLLREQEAKDRELEKKRREKLELVKKMKEEQVKEEIYYSKELKKDMKIFLREQERETRKEKAKQQQEIINNLRLSKQAAAFEARQNKEINELEKIAFKAEKEDYQEVLDRISAIRLKYKNLRLESYRKKLEELGIEVQGDEDRAALLEKEKRLLIQKSEKNILKFNHS